MEISRSWYYYQSVDRTIPDNVELEKIGLIREEFCKHPFYGYRKISVALAEHGMTEKMTRRLMKKIGLQAIFPGKKTSTPNQSHQKYPYLLKGKEIIGPNHVWATDITYIKQNGANVYLAAVVDLFSRKVLSWRLSNTMEANFCVDVLEEALRIYGVPAIFNTDQGSQFTSDSFIDVLKSNGIRISMDGKGRALDNIYVERLWRSLKYEEIYLHSYPSMIDLKEGINSYFRFFNTERFHQSLEYATPDEIYFGAFAALKTA